MCLLMIIWLKEIINIIILGVSIYFKAYSPPFGFSDFCKSLQIGSHIHQFLELEFSSKLENIQKIHEFVSIQ